MADGTGAPTPTASGSWGWTARLDRLGRFLMSQPFENYSTGFSGYDPSNKAAIVVRKGWIVGESYNQVSAQQAVYCVTSNGKTMSRR
ncbi:MAG TPA: hypothetical protein VIQ27_14695 [Gemmatimonadales bacterium]|jgi:hypothetical protein